MKIIADLSCKKPFKRKINENTYLINIPAYFFPLGIAGIFLRYAAVGRTEFFASENLKAHKKAYTFLNKRICFKNDDTAVDIFLKYTDKIIKTLKTGEKLKICVVCEKRDERMFTLCEKIKDFTDIIYFIGTDEEFYEDVNRYCLDKYGIGVSIREPREVYGADVIIILNSSNADFAASLPYVINLCRELQITEGNVLEDIFPYGCGDFTGVKIKKCQFMPENCTNFNLIWRNCGKTIDKTKK